MGCIPGHYWANSFKIITDMGGVSDGCSRHRNRTQAQVTCYRTKHTSWAGFANLFWFLSKPIFDTGGGFAFCCRSLHVQDFFLKQCSNCTNICIVNMANRIFSGVERKHWCIHNKGRHATPRQNGDAHGVLIMEEWKYCAPVESHSFNATLFDAGRN